MSVDTNSEDPKPSNPLRSFPYTQKIFEAAGHTYYVEDMLSIERYKFFQRMELELGYGARFSELSQKLQKAYQLQNESKFADVSVLLYGMMEGMTFIGEKKPIALYVATLFINRSDEDRTKWSQAIAEEKLKDWTDIEVNFFLIIALSKVNNFSETLKEVSQTIEGVGQIKRLEMEDFSDLPND